MLVQLKKLREGAGLKRERLLQAGSVMSSLATADPDEAHERLVQIIGRLDDQHRSVLAVDFGLELERYLEREPNSREQRWLGARRDAYGLIVERDRKTLARWSDAALGELRAQLLSDTFTGHLYLVVVVDGDRVRHVAMVQEELQQPGHDGVDVQPTERQTVEFENPTEGHSPPCFLYAFPRDWQPASLTLAVSFQSEPYPERVWGFHAANFIEASFAADRYELTLRDGTATCRFQEPPRGRVYGVWWQYATMASS